MKRNISYPVILLLAIAIAFATTSALAQKTTPELNQKGVRTNPEYVKRLADPEFNPQLKSVSDPAERLRIAQATADQSCQTMTVTTVFVATQHECFIEITYKHTYTYSAASTNAYTLPHGISFQTCTQPIESVTVISGAWLNGLSPVISGNSVYWVKPCTGTSNFSNIIPSGQLLKVRIKLANGFCPGTCEFKTRELNGWAFPNATQFWNCEQPYSVSLPAQWVNYSIGGDTSVCSGSAFTLTASSIGFIPIPPGATVKWYKFIPVSCTDPCPPPPNCYGTVAAPWVEDITGSINYNTNILTQNVCYAAVISYGCIRSVTNVRRVNVCPGPPNNNIVPNGPPTTMINSVPHACTNWSGSLCLDGISGSCCKVKVSKWEKRSRNLSYPSACSPVWGNWTNWSTLSHSIGENCINTGNLQAVACQTQYEFRAVLSNACGQSTPSFSIIIDKAPVPGSISADPAGTLCFDKATKLSYTTTCAEIVEWEMREETSPCSNTYSNWAVIQGSQGTCIWWTGNLQRTTQYRVRVKNGACGLNTSVYSAVYTVKIKPKLAVTITANQTILCSPVTLTAQTSYSGCGYTVTYQWYKDGLPITGATQATYHPTTGGNYYVVIKDGHCGKANSNVITICERPELVVKAPCCVCNGETITLQAEMLWNPGNCSQSCSYQWNTGATTSSINVSSPGTYTVTVSCGPCSVTKTVIIKPCI
jgi:hypothetical protein